MLATFLGFYYQRCYIFMQEKNSAALAAELAKAKEEKCVTHAMLNLEAYHLASTGVNLERALQAIDEALKMKH